MKKESKDSSLIVRNLFSKIDDTSEPNLYIGAGNELALFRCTGLVTYKSDTVVLKTAKGNLTVRGECLKLKSFSMSEICVCGKIKSVELWEM